MTDTEFCWLVELFLPNGGNSLGWYHTGFTDLGGNSRSTKDPYQARRYSKSEAEAIAAKLGFTLQGVWCAVEHGFDSDAPAKPATPIRTLLILLAAFCLLSACTGSATPDDAIVAQQQCSQRGGYAHVSRYERGKNLVIECADGSQIDMRPGDRK